MGFTESQNNAITANNISVLVSAGAGSGKTTVLTTRIIEKIKAGGSVADFLVVTFTNASALDLREKLYNALTAAVAENPNDRHIISQLFLLPGANISTIHSFCYDKIRENFALLGYSPKIRILDSTESDIIKAEIMQESVSCLLAEDDEDFIRLMDNFTSAKSDENFIKTALKIYDNLRALQDCDKRLKDLNPLIRTLLEDENKDFHKTEIGTLMRENAEYQLSELKKDIELLYGFVVERTSNAACFLCVNALADGCESLLAAIKSNRDAFISACDELLRNGLPNVVTKGMTQEDADYFKAEKGRISNSLMQIINDYAQPDAVVYSDANTLLSLNNALSRLLVLFDAKYTEHKKSRGTQDFADLEQGMLKLLQEEKEDGSFCETELCLRLRESIKEVFIDEYQDVNPLQDRIFSLISNGKNSFMVGDIKQSIYRFRNAYPDIFVSYKNQYADYFQGTESNSRIFLRENFRCAKPVIDYVNHLFDTVTVNTPFAEEYKNEGLIFAKQNAGIPEPVRIRLAPFGKKSETIKQQADESAAEYVACEIERLMKDGINENGKPFAYKDIALLFSAVRGHSEVYEAALKRHGIPFSRQQSSAFLQKPAILLMTSILRAVDDPTDDISLFSFMRSPVCNFTSQELYEIRLHSQNGCLAESVRLYKNGGKRKASKQKGKFKIVKKESKQTLISKCRGFLLFLQKLCEESRGVACHEYLLKVCSVCGLMTKSFADKSFVKSVQTLYNYARGFESSGFKGLSGFIEYLSAMEENRVELDTTEQNENDCVSVMSIHKSKGLEFPVVFFCSAERQFSSQGGDGYIFLREKGLFYKTRNNESCSGRDSCFYKYAKQTEKTADMGEEYRKLYVALTRARHILYIIASFNTGSKPIHNAMSAASDLELILFAEANEKGFADVALIEKPESQTNASARNTQERLRVLCEQELADVRFSYPFADSSLIPAKAAVSEIRQGLLENSEYEAQRRTTEILRTRILKKPAFLGCEADAASKGTANHIFMQFCDFSSVDEYGVEAEAERLLEQKLLSDEQYRMLNPQKIKDFFRSRLYSEMRASKKLYREKRFAVTRDSSCITPISGETVLIQGVIDCFFENPDSTYTVVDYKTDRVKSGEELCHRHSLQLSFYREAVESMTKSKVSRALLYSFELSSEFEI